jgi:hypothetical protein
MEVRIVAIRLQPFACGENSRRHVLLLVVAHGIVGGERQQQGKRQRRSK